MSETIISVRDLYKIFGANPEAQVERVKAGVGKSELMEEYGHALGLQDINLDVKSGETFVVMGLSGSGKSTLIRHFNRLIDPTAGEVLVAGEDIMAMQQPQLEKFRQKTMSMVFQRFGLLPHKTVIENVAYGLKIQGIGDLERRDRSMKWIERVGLGELYNQYPSQLSGGQQQRVGLARALATDSDILLMDEAFSALDPLIRNDMQGLLLELQDELHKTIVFITHDLDEAMRIADSLVILKDGLIEQQGNPQDIVLNPAQGYVEEFVQEINRARVLRTKSIMKPSSAKQFDVTLSIDDNLEKAISAAEGRTEVKFGVSKDDEIVGEFLMEDLIAALATRESSSKAA